MSKRIPDLPLEQDIEKISLEDLLAFTKVLEDDDYSMKLLTLIGWIRKYYWFYDIIHINSADGTYFELPEGRYIVLVDTLTQPVELRLPDPTGKANIIEYNIIDATNLAEFNNITVTSLRQSDSNGYIFYKGMTDRKEIKLSGLGARFYSDGTHWFPDNDYANLLNAIEKNPFAYTSDLTMYVLIDDSTLPNNQATLIVDPYGGSTIGYSYQIDLADAATYFTSQLTAAAGFSSFSLTQVSTSKKKEFLMNSDKTIFQDDITQKGIEYHEDIDKANFNSKTLIPLEHLGDLVDALSSQGVVNSSQATAIKAAIGL